MSAFWLATGIVALAEVGDKTQLLTLVLVLRYAQPWSILVGIVIATLANHAAAAGLGVWLTQWADAQALGDWLRWLLAASFFAMAVWVLIPDQLDDADKPQRPATSAWTVLLITTAAFFMAEMGDKTQIATVMLGAQNSAGVANNLGAWLAVVAGTTAGMLVANAPVLILGQRLMAWLQQGQRLVMAHRVCAGVFAAMGVAVIWR